MIKRLFTRIAQDARQSPADVATAAIVVLQILGALLLVLAALTATALLSAAVAWFVAIPTFYVYTFLFIVYGAPSVTLPTVAAGYFLILCIISLTGFLFRAILSK